MCTIQRWKRIWIYRNFGINIFGRICKLNWKVKKFNRLYYNRCFISYKIVHKRNTIKLYFHRYGKCYVEKLTSSLFLFFFLFTFVRLIYSWNRCRSLFSNRKSVHGTVTLLENLHLILKKTSREYIESEVLPMLYTSFENSTTQVQVRR